MNIRGYHRRWAPGRNTVFRRIFKTGRDLADCRGEWVYLADDVRRPGFRPTLVLENKGPPDNPGAGTGCVSGSGVII